MGDKFSNLIFIAYNEMLMKEKTYLQWMTFMYPDIESNRRN